MGIISQIKAYIPNKIVRTEIFAEETVLREVLFKPPGASISLIDRRVTSNHLVKGDTLFVRERAAVRVGKV
jgi:hypothetical protein